MTRDPATRSNAGRHDVVQGGEVRSARIESLRALAALGVAVAHAWSISHDRAPVATDGPGDRLLVAGTLGVYVFFALTGYLLSWPFVRRHVTGARVDLRTYARNRALRILPLYWTSVVVLLLAEGGTPGDWWRFLLLAENFSAETIGSLNPVLWSIVVEVHFYAVLPLVAALVALVARRTERGAVLAVGALGLASAAVWVTTVGSAPGSAPLWRYNLPATFVFFVAGGLLAFARAALERGRPAWTGGPLGSADAWVLASMPLWALLALRPELAPLAAGAAFLLVGACVLPLRPGRALRVLDARPLVVLGVASYSLYIWHVPVLDALQDASPAVTPPLLAVVGLGVACAIALTSYRLVEEPFLRLRGSWSPSAASRVSVRRRPREHRRVRDAAEPDDQLLAAERREEVAP